MVKKDTFINGSERDSKQDNMVILCVTWLLLRYKKPTGKFIQVEQELCSSVIQRKGGGQAGRESKGLYKILFEKYIKWMNLHEGETASIFTVKCFSGGGHADLLSVVVSGSLPVL